MGQRCVGVLAVVPDLASSSAFSLPQCPEWANPRHARFYSSYSTFRGLHERVSEFSKIQNANCED